MIMYKKKSILVWVIILTALVLFAFAMVMKRSGESEKKTVITPLKADVVLTVTTTGVVEPQNRLEVKPSISGRVEKIMVKEGDKVTTGEILAWMSSTERAALIDAARGQGEEVLQYWEEVYKRTPIVSPIDGEVIVRSVEPGQTVTTADPILVLSDRLVVNAQFDETDIARVRVGQKAVITLDAYPDINIEGVVDHIAYESKIVNNVTIYDVDVLPKNVPEILRSGMSVTVEVVEKTKENVLTVPSSTIHYDQNRQFVVVQDSSGNFMERDVTVGLNNDKIAEVVSGLTPEDKVAVWDNLPLPKKKDTGTNPFMPFGRKKK